MATRPTAKPGARVAPNRHTLAYQLREIIDARGLTPYAAGQLAGVDPGVLSRFMRGRRDIRLDTADRLAAALGIRLVEVARKPRAVRPDRADVGASDGPAGRGIPGEG